jgi:hypothetical protein
VIIDPGPRVLGFVAPHAQAEHEAPAREQLEGGGLLGDGSRLAQRQLEHTGAQAHPGGGGGGDREGRQGLRDRVGPEEMVGRPEGIGAQGLGPPAQLGNGTGTIGST